MDTALDIEFPNEIMGHLQGFKQSQLYTDVTLKTGVCEIKCHRVILAAGSPYFNKIFNAGLQKTPEDCYLDEIDATTLGLVVDYFYWTNIDITLANVKDLIQAGDQFLLPGLLELCEDFMIKQTIPENALGFYNVAVLYGLKRLRTQTYTTILRIFTTVNRSKDFSDMTIESLIGYLSDNELNVVPEDQVFEAMVRWMEFDIIERQSYFQRIVEHIRLAHCTSYFLTNVVAPYPLMSQGECPKYLKEAFRYKMMPSERHIAQSQRTLPRNASPGHGSLVVVGGEYNMGGLCKDIMYMRERDSEFKLLTRLPNGTAYCSAVAFNNGILITGGHAGDPSYPRKECHFFDVKTKRWCGMPPMLQARCWHGSVVHDNRIYVAGGSGAHSRLKSMEMYDHTQKRWSNITDMPEVIPFAQVVSCVQYVCVLGRRVVKMFVYDTRNGKWENRKTIPYQVTRFLATALNGRIYVVSGSPPCCMSYNMHTDTWAVLESPTNGTEHKLGNASPWRGNIVLVGGMGTKVINEYNPKENIWTVLPKKLRRTIFHNCLLTLDIT